jgi:hemoglobin-like flavoprotein
MTPEQIRIVQSTWLQVLPVKEAAAQCFYDRVFELDPSLRKLFRGDIRSQGQKLMQVIDAAVNGLSRLEQIVPVIQALGRRHAGYGVKDDHYGTVGAALLWTLGKMLGADFTPQAKDAWATVYGTLATTMREAAHESDDANQIATQPQNVVGTTTPPKESVLVARDAIDPVHAAFLVTAFGLAAAIGLGIALNTSDARSKQPPAAAAPPAGTDHSRFILNALLVPALDSDALPLRWVDPRAASLCGPNTTVRVNGEPLSAGALVPNAPFELEWHANGCRPFGKAGPRFDGWVKLTVFREDWGFSAMVEPSGLRITSAENVIAMIKPGAASLPPQGQGDADDTVEPTMLCAEGAPSCR